MKQAMKYSSSFFVIFYLCLSQVQNREEAATVVKMAAVLQEQNTRFRIITPYDAQRALIEKSLKDAGLAFANKCFNVDSFQGVSIDSVYQSKC